MKTSHPAPEQPHAHAPVSLGDIQVVPVVDASQRRRLHALLKAHHYLGDLKPVGEILLYAAVDPSGRWLAVLVFNAAAKHLKARDPSIGWNCTQRERRLGPVSNNGRFLILPDAHQPNLGSRVLRLALDRLSDDWLAA